MAGVFAARPLDDSTRWAAGLRCGGREREEAVFRLRAHLVGAALFELRRRRVAGDGVQDREAARLVRDAAEAALDAILADLARYRGQSAFATWTAKYAIREAAAAARAREVAARTATGERR